MECPDCGGALDPTTLVCSRCGRKPDLVHYHIRLQMAGFEGPFVYRVGEDEWNRVQKALSVRTERTSSSDSFVVFSTKDELDVAVSVRHLEIAQFLFDTGIPSATTEDQEEDDGYISVYLVGRATPYRTHMEDASEFASLFGLMEVWDLNEEPFMSFTDEDGEAVMIRADRVALVEADASVLEEGREEFPNVPPLPKGEGVRG